MAKVKLKLGYDNLEDAKTKLGGTFCLYKDQPFVVKNVGYQDGTLPEENKFFVNGAPMTGRKALPGQINIDDPDFNCSDYNIGYMNVNGFATWFYRIPFKQYQQGLRHTQVAARASNPAYNHVEFRACIATANMLENKYPTYREASKMLKGGDSAVIAFNRNFALSHDTIHGDFIIEYKGQQIGFTPNLEDFKIIKEHEHVYEALKEAIG